MRDTNEVDCLASEVRIVMELVANGVGLPTDSLEHGSNFAVTNFDTLDWCGVID